MHAMIRPRAEKGIIAMTGFYREHDRVGYTSFGAWDSFGPGTRSSGNTLYERDGKSALVRSKYLGVHAQGFPSPDFGFPLSLVRTIQGGQKRVLRTILSVNEEDQSVIFVGDVPEKAYAR